jgi:hypothetical protein
MVTCLGSCPGFSGEAPGSEGTDLIGLEDLLIHTRDRYVIKDLFEPDKAKLTNLINIINLVYAFQLIWTLIVA